MRAYKRHDEIDLARIGRRVALVRHLYADLGCAIGEIQDDRYTDEFLEISDGFNELTDFDDGSALQLMRKIVPLMQKMEADESFYFEWEFRFFRVADKRYWMAERKPERIVLL